MASGSRHRILRQILDIDTDTPAAARAVQEALAMPFRDGNLPELEQLFDRLASPNTQVRVNRLEVDLGTLSGPDWFDAFFDRLQAKLGQALDSSGEQTGPGTDVGISRHVVKENDFERLAFFLERGRLPWWSRRPTATDWIDTSLTKLTGRQWQALLQLVRRSDHARRRFVAMANDLVRERAVEVWAGLPLARQLLLAVSQSDDLRGVNPEYWHFLIRHLVSGATDGPRLVRDLLHLVASGPRRPTGSGTFETGIPGTAGRLAAISAAAARLPDPWRKWLRQVIDDGPGPDSPQQETCTRDARIRRPAPENADDTEPRRQSDDKTNRSAPDPAARGPDDDITSGRLVSMREWLDGKRERTTDRTPPLAPENEGAIEVYVDGAGVVIIHPFLRELFESRELLRDNEFVDNAARHRAVRMLAYLTFGTEMRPEYELLLAKVLCNLRWEVPLAEVELDDDERTSCDELLEAVLRHWTALKGCSVAWMREQFFLRDGRIEQVDHGWKLTVERHAQDVLLARLPWGFGVIHLPWQPAQVYVNWLE